MASSSRVSTVVVDPVFDDEGDAVEGDEDEDEDVDDLSNLLISLQLEDLEALERESKGKCREDTGDDATTAYSLYREELMALQRYLADQKIARSIDSAMNEDAGILETFAREEYVARRDRQIAIALSEGREMPPADPNSSAEPSGTSSCSSAGPSGMSSHSSAGPSGTSSHSSAGSSQSTLVTAAPPAKQELGASIFVQSAAFSSRTTTKTVIKLECVICMTAVSTDEAVKVPCGHHYDFDCLIELFLQATKDESLIPARCCKQHIPLDLARPHLSQQQIMEYRTKELEHNTSNRLYCPKATCSAFLGAADKSRGIVTCYKCAARVCPDCKGLEHLYGECHPNFGDETLLELARREGYQRCPACRRFTELTHGCYHMTCACRTDFCYRCGALWKTCDCPQWDEDRLLDRAQQQVRAEFGRPAQRAQVPLYRERIAQAVNNLRYNHDCAHTRWGYRSGGGRCEECGHYLPIFLLRCAGCQLLACVRCRRNRL